MVWRQPGWPVNRAALLSLEAAPVAEFLEAGGSYLGLCAGAYYACERVLFQPGTALAVCGDRELALFPGVAVGSVAPAFDYSSELGAQVCCLMAMPP